MQNIKGFTLIELLISCSIFAILVATAVPTLQQTLALSDSKHITHTLNRLASAARETAIKGDYNVKLCGINENLECSKENFKHAVIFNDLNDDHIVDINKELIAWRDLPQQGNVSLKASAGREYIQFKNDGSTSQAGSFIYCNADYPSAHARITISMSGRAYIARKKDANGYITQTSGAAISC